MLSLILRTAGIIRKPNTFESQRAPPRNMRVRPSGGSTRHSESTEREISFKVQEACSKTNERHSRRIGKEKRGLGGELTSSHIAEAEAVC